MAPVAAHAATARLIWPGFVDAVTTLLMVLMFVLTIFTIMQSVLRDEITTQDTELDALTARSPILPMRLGLERTRATDLEARDRHPCGPGWPRRRPRANGRPR